jgi:hypothetical protein
MFVSKDIRFIMLTPVVNDIILLLRVTDGRAKYASVFPAKPLQHSLMFASKERE